MDQYIGKMLDNRYEILEVIGVGGMAVVYKAMCHRLNRLVAIKILKDEYSNDAEFRRRFHGESQAVAMMSHPNIVNVYDVSKNDDIDYIVMELIDGITLKQYMERKGMLSWRETLHFSMQIAKALEHAHSRNIIHRDIKPHNIMILKDGSVKVADFGIARVASAQNTLTKEALGSVHYISPEQAKGARVDNRTDLYSLGVVMYQMLTGRPPFDGDSPVSVAIQHINGTPLLPSLLNSNIPTGLEQITMHAMCADLDKRYGSATDMLRDMEEFRKNPTTVFSFAPDGSTAAATTAPRAPRPVVRTPQEVRKPPTEERIEDDYDDERKERRKIVITIALIAAGVLLLIGLTILAFHLFFNDDSSEISKNEEPSAETELNEIVVPDLFGKKLDEQFKLEDYPDLAFKLEYEYSDVIPENAVITQSISANSKVEPGTEVVLTISLGELKGEMPDLIGRSTDYAMTYLDKMGLDISGIAEEVFDDEIPLGYVVRTDPIAGEKLKQNDIVTVYISKGPEIKMAKVPNVIGTSKSNAMTAITARNLKCSVVEDYSDTIAVGFVCGVYPAADTELEEGSTVTITVSKGKRTVAMINVVGQQVGTASDALTQLGLIPTVSRVYSDSAAEGTVISQSYEQGTELELGTSVLLTVSLGPDPTNTEPPTETPTEATEPTGETTEEPAG